MNQILNTYNLIKKLILILYKYVIIIFIIIYIDEPSRMVNYYNVQMEIIRT